MEKKIVSKSPLETQEIGRKLAFLLEKGDVVALVGDLGTGKTTFVKGIAEGLGIASEHVNSPSFVICQEYQGRIPLYHFDLHRMTGETDLQRLEIEVGFGDYLDGDGVTVVEWANRALSLLPQDYLEICFQMKDNGSRELLFHRKGKWQAKPFWWLLGMVLEKYFFRQHYAKAERWLKDDVEDLHARIKKFLNTFQYTYRP